MKAIKTRAIIFILGIVVTVSCAKIPAQSIDLMTAIQNEGERMHNINIMLANTIFKEKRNKIDAFIQNDYTPKFMDEFTKRIPQGTDLKTELPNILASIVPTINERRDAMQNALEINRVKVVDKLNTDYQQFKTAGDALKELLESAVKLDEEKKKLLNQASGLTKNKIDFDKLESDLDRFVSDAGDIGNTVNNLNENIDALLNK